jgi:hypothetical protein
LPEHPLKRGLQEILACLDAPGEEDRGAHQALSAFGQEFFQALESLILSQQLASLFRPVTIKYERARRTGAPHCISLPRVAAPVVCSGRNYTVARGGMAVATVSQQRTLRDRFAIEVAAGEDAVLTLAVILVIETIRAARRAAASGG